MLRRWLDRIYLAAGALGAGFIVLICVLMVAQSIMRELGLRTGAINDIVAWFCAAAAFMAMAHAFKHGDFVRVTLILEKLPPRRCRQLETVALSIGAVAVGYLMWAACSYTYESWEFNDMATGMVALPMWIPQMSLVVGAVLFTLAVLDELYLVLQGQQPTYVRLVEERHAKGDFSSDL